MRTLVVAALAMALTGCPKPFIPNAPTFTERVVCYSGGEIVLQDDTDRNGVAFINDIYTFTSKHTGNYYRVPVANCIVSQSP